MDNTENQEAANAELKPNGNMMEDDDIMSFVADTAAPTLADDIIAATKQQGNNEAEAEPIAAGLPRSINQKGAVANKISRGIGAVAKPIARTATGWANILKEIGSGIDGGLGGAISKIGGAIQGKAEQAWEAIREAYGNPSYFKDLDPEEQDKYRRKFWERLAYANPEKYGQVSAGMIGQIDQRAENAKNRILQSEQMKDKEQREGWNILKQEQSNLHTRMAGSMNRLGELYRALSETAADSPAFSQIQSQIKEQQRQLELDQQDMNKVTVQMNESNAPDYYIRREDRIRDKNTEDQIEELIEEDGIDKYEKYQEFADLIQGNDVKKLKGSEIQKRAREIAAKDERFKDIDSRSLEKYINIAQATNSQNYNDNLEREKLRLGVKGAGRQDTQGNADAERKITRLENTEKNLANYEKSPTFGNFKLIENELKKLSADENIDLSGIPVVGKLLNSFAGFGSSEAKFRQNRAVIDQQVKDLLSEIRTERNALKGGKNKNAQRGNAEDF